MKMMLCLLFSFLLGSIPTAFLLAKKVKGVDIRQHGSGNVGATNAFRVLGKKYGALVFIFDFLKGAVPAWITAALYSTSSEAPLLALLVGMAAILGHIFTPFLGFKGGKGVATGSGVLCASYPILFVCTMLIWTVAFFLTRTVSLSSLLAIAGLVLTSLWWDHDIRATLAFFSLFLLILWSHRSNIYRLLRGEEYKFAKKR